MSESLGTAYILQPTTFSVINSRLQLWFSFRDAKEIQVGNNLCLRRTTDYPNVDSF